MASSASSSKENAAKIKALLKEVPDERGDAARLDELRRLFRSVVPSATDASSSSSSQILNKWERFLRDKRNQMILQLCRRIAQHRRRTACRTFFGMLSFGTPTDFHNYMLQFVSALIDNPDDVIDADSSLGRMLQLEFLVYGDVQQHSLLAIAKLANQTYEQQQQQHKDEEALKDILSRVERLLDFLMMIPTTATPTHEIKYLLASNRPQDDDKNDESDKDDDNVPEEEANDHDNQSSSSDDSSDSDSSDSEDEEPAPKRKKLTPPKLTYHAGSALSKAWLAVLKLKLTPTALKRALLFLPKTVFPAVPDPLRFANFFLKAYSQHQTITIPLLALEGLFGLMTEHGLEYPNFYAQLYQLLATPHLLYFQSNNTRFWMLLSNCLTKNQMLPAHVIAAFCKRLLRCALLAPPCGILFSLALVSNVLKKRPECAGLLHRTGKEEEEEDVYNASTHDLTQTQALQSSLWELNALEHHYHPAVSTLAKSVGRQDVNMPQHNLQEFSSHSYKSLFEQDRKRKRTKKTTPVTFVEPKEGLFTPYDLFANIVELA